MPWLIDADGKRHGISTVTLDEYVAYKSRYDEKGCLIWHGKINRQGYPELTQAQAAKSGFRLAYHYTWFKHTGTRVERPLQIDHICRVRACIEPTHLEVVTARENLMRGDTLARKNAEKLHCPQGHAYDTVNVNGDRGCKQCKAENSRRYRARKGQVR
jgi:hypothetical protein